jgi:hypothetical protein
MCHDRHHARGLQKVFLSACSLAYIVQECAPRILVQCGLNRGCSRCAAGIRSSTMIDTMLEDTAESVPISMHSGIHSVLAYIVQERVSRSLVQCGLTGGCSLCAQLVLMSLPFAAPLWQCRCTSGCESMHRSPSCYCRLLSAAQWLSCRITASTDRQEGLAQLVTLSNDMVNAACTVWSTECHSLERPACLIGLCSSQVPRRIQCYYLVNICCTDCQAMTAASLSGLSFTIAWYLLPQL